MVKWNGIELSDYGVGFSFVFNYFLLAFFSYKLHQSKDFEQRREIRANIRDLRAKLRGEFPTNRRSFPFPDASSEPAVLSYLLRNLWSVFVRVTESMML